MLLDLRVEPHHGWSVHLKLLYIDTYFQRDRCRDWFADSNNAPGDALSEIFLFTQGSAILYCD